MARRRRPLTASTAQSAFVALGGIVPIVTPPAAIKTQRAALAELKKKSAH